ncbi:MAG: Mov34/MPN/PAD-1 family protein [archaeon]
MHLLKKVKQLFLPRPIQQLILQEAVLDKICDLSKDSYPKEFLAFLEGKTEKGKLVITDIVYQMYLANEYAALPRMDLPIINNVLGTVHSHPSGSAKPSGADKQFFKHQGIVHFIIANPFTKENLHCYDKEGNELIFQVIQ